MFPARTAITMCLSLLLCGSAGADFYQNIFNGASQLGGAYMSNAPVPAPITMPPPVMAPAPVMAPPPAGPYVDPFHQNQATVGSPPSGTTTTAPLTPQQIQMLKQQQSTLQPPPHNVAPPPAPPPQTYYYPSAPVTGFNAPRAPAVLPPVHAAPRRHR